MSGNVRVTVPVARLLALLLADPTADRYGLDLMRGTGLPSGTLYPMLARLVRAGWLEAHWEAVDPHAAGRPARRYYRLTAVGQAEGHRSLRELHDSTRPVRPPVTGWSTT